MQQPWQQGLLSQNTHSCLPTQGSGESCQLPDVPTSSQAPGLFLPAYLVESQEFFTPGGKLSLLKAPLPESCLHVFDCSQPPASHLASSGLHFPLGRHCWTLPLREDIQLCL